MHKRYVAIYSVSRGYRKCVVWEGNSVTGRKTCTCTISPGKSLTRHERYMEIAHWLSDNFNLDIGGYCATAVERKIA